MHNRDLIWQTRDRLDIKIKDMESSHLTNTIRYIENNIEKYYLKFGKKKVKEYLYNFKQEVRFRKINKLNSID
jgi:hypothetical protein